MKNIFLLLILALSVGQLSAQSCHSMASGKSGCCSKSASAAMTAADDSGIQIRKDVATGDLSYHKKTSCAYSSQASFVEVSFDAKSNIFVNKAPSASRDLEAISVSNHTMEMKKMDCSQMSKAECAAKMAKGECQPKAKT
jgi:hypothetical protein